MKIALTVPLYTLGVDGTGGVGVFVQRMAKALLERGHEVDVLTVKKSIVDGNKIVIMEEGIFDHPMPLEHSIERDIVGTKIALKYLQDNYQQYDVIHNNMVNHLAFEEIATLPKSITTFHQPADSLGITTALKNNQDVAKANFVAISTHQQQSINLNFIKMIPHGLDLNDFVIGDGRGDYIAWLSRIEPEKGIEDALTVADYLKLQLKFAGIKRDPEFYQKIMKRSQETKASFLGFLNKDDSSQLLKNARCLLFPTYWDEPFGLVVIEAIASGTPVVAYDNGAMSELIKDGVTGDVVPSGDIAALQAAVKKIFDMPEVDYQNMRSNCRREVESKYTIDKMVDSYEKLYQEISGNH